MRDGTQAVTRLLNGIGEVFGFDDGEIRRSAALTS
jgi:hypothetical protein